MVWWLRSPIVGLFKADDAGGYERHSGYVEAFREAGVKLITLSNYEAVIEEAAKTGYIKEEDKAVLAEWRKSPSTWKV